MFMLLKMIWLESSLSLLSFFLRQVVRREWVTLWHELLPSLVSLSNKGPIEVSHAILNNWPLILLIMNTIISVIQ